MATFKSDRAKDLVRKHAQKIRADLPLSAQEKHAAVQAYMRELKDHERQSAEARLKELPGMAQAVIPYLRHLTGVDMTGLVAKWQDRNIGKAIKATEHYKRSLEAKIDGMQEELYAVTSKMVEHEETILAYRNAREELRDDIKAQLLEINKLDEALRENPTDYQARRQQNALKKEFNRLEADLRAYTETIEEESSAYLVNKSEASKMAFNIESVKVVVSDLEGAVRDAKDYQHTHSPLGLTGTLQQAGGFMDVLYARIGKGPGAAPSSDRIVGALQSMSDAVKTGAPDMDNDLESHVGRLRGIVDEQQAAREKVVDLHIYRQYKKAASGDSPADLIQ